MSVGQQCCVRLYGTLRMTDKSSQRSNVNRLIYYKTIIVRRIYSFRNSILGFATACSQKNSNLYIIIDQEKHNLERIYIRNLMTTRLTLIYVIRMESLSLKRRRLSCETSLAARSEERQPYSQARLRACLYEVSQISRQASQPAFLYKHSDNFMRKQGITELGHLL